MAGAQKECEFKSKNRVGNHRASAVGLSISQLQSDPQPRDTTALQAVVFQFHSYDSEPQSGNRREVSKSSYIPISSEVEVPPAKAWWCSELNITLLRGNGFVSRLLAAPPTVVI
jgi:hypothetical protein